MSGWVSYLNVTGTTSEKYEGGDWMEDDGVDVITNRERLYKFTFSCPLSKFFVTSSGENKFILRSDTVDGPVSLVGVPRLDKLSVGIPHGYGYLLQQTKSDRHQQWIHS